MVLITTSDNETFNVDKDVIERSVLFKDMLDSKIVFDKLEKKY